ncbi:hypothetical protein FC96_GL001356 [Secundilactobacillus kimchicus JCM 15530]|uniref:Uncharacterized protein n=1 Tax=Secundilactobacillus kimchicus JCM 15530 TaxID=1302272 RepID=A0A0R1HYM7_9LACO|nr:hypothetical protein FC96_GL001356 [Secundilactobacillus kimchicus JCM 15530]
MTEKTKRAVEEILKYGNFENVVELRNEVWAFADEDGIKQAIENLANEIKYTDNFIVYPNNFDKNIQKEFLKLYGKTPLGRDTDSEELPSKQIELIGLSKANKHVRDNRPVLTISFE